MGENMIIKNGNFIVYIHTNKVNGKMYVGITSQSTDARWRQGKGYKHCIAFHRAIEKYGWDGFEHEVFAANLTREEAENMEKILIEKLNTQNPEFGYNISEGGNAPRQTDETKRKISESRLGEKNPMFGRKHTAEEQDNLSKRFSGSGNPRYGVSLSEETKQKISEAQKGKHLTEEHKKKIADTLSKKFKGRPRPDGGGRPPKSILCVETGEIFESIAEAAKSKGIKSKNRISAVAKGTAITCGGYHWEYVNSSIL